MYPDENDPVLRDLRLRPEGDYLHVDLIDKKNPMTGGFSLSVQEVKVLRDNLNTILKNKLIEEI
jgi:hypothetical protein